VPPSRSRLGATPAARRGRGGDLGAGVGVRWKVWSGTGEAAVERRSARAECGLPTVSAPPTPPSSPPYLSCLLVRGSGRVGGGLQLGERAPHGGAAPVGRRDGQERVHGGRAG
jgi:hypothetical protein